jgi:hypothetical protein
MGFKGYQGSFPDFLAALRVKKSNYDDAGKVEVNINNPVVGQLWDEVMGLLAFTRSVMVPFLKVFGVVEGHGLSPFAVKINTPQDLRQIIIQYFKTPKKITSTVIHQNVTSIDDDCEDDNEDDVNVGDTVEGMSDSVLANHVTEIEIQEDGDDMDGGNGLLSFENELSSTQSNAVASIFGNGGEDEIQTSFRKLVSCNSIDGVGDICLKLVELLQLGKLEQGSVSPASKVNSRNA